MRADFLPRLLKLIASAFLVLTSDAIVCCAQVDRDAEIKVSAGESQPKAQTFDLRGKVVTKTKYGFQIVTATNQRIDIKSNESTDFALRMNRPWFRTEDRKAIVDGKQLVDGSRERIVYGLPAGPLYLLVQFRTIAQRDRIVSKSPWRINNYLIGGTPIKEAMPNGDSLFMAGRFDFESSELVIAEKRYPILLGQRAATLRGRSIADLVPGETIVAASGTRNEDGYVADTVLFMVR